jgi:predicted ferric reductase/Ca2+-binding EF-hand superfamily protein
MLAEDEGARGPEVAPDRSSHIAELSRAPDDAPPRSSQDAALHPLDAELLEHLERRFAEIAGPDDRISVAELAHALRIHSADLAGRLLAAFDRNRDGDVDASDFLGCVRRLLSGSIRDKLLFAFRVHDVDGNGTLTQTELERMIALGLAEDSVVYPKGEPARLAALLLRRADRDGDGRLSFDEFAAAIGGDTETLRQVTTSGACWLAPNEALLGPAAPRLPRAVRLRRYAENHRIELAFLAAWAIGHSVLFELAREAHAGEGALMQIAHGAARGACLDAALILFPTMRGLLTFLQERRWSKGVSFGSTAALHDLLGTTLFVLALVHTAAHLAIVEIIHKGHVFSTLIAAGPRRTGLEWLAVFAIMWVFARKRLRRFSFDAFYVTHLAFPIWFAIGLVHAPVFPAWVALPLLAYGVERVVRYGARINEVEIIDLRPLRSGVTRITLEKPEGFAQQPGQFVFLRLPQIAAREWHPFTISSAPEQQRLTLHVRVLGDFSKRLRELAEERSRKRDDSRLVAQIDGPYGAPCVDVFDSPRVVLVAGGIGVTPFASVLESIVCRLREAPLSRPLQRLDFFWLNRDQYSFEWFAELLGRLAAMDGCGFVHVHVFMTGARADAACAALNLAVGLTRAAGGSDVVTGLGLRTHMGDPSWADELDAIVKDAGETPVRAYFCGPEGLGNKVSKACRERGVDFRREIF